jgi:hypothetical protein
MGDLPVTAVSHASPTLCAAIVRFLAAEPLTSDSALYDPAMQGQLRETLRNEAGQASFDAWSGEIKTALGLWPHAVLVRGIPVERPHNLMVALTSILGTAVDPYMQPWSRLVREIRPARDRSVDGWGMLNEALHTDGTDWPDPNDYTCLLCVRPDQGRGGLSKIMAQEDIVAELTGQFGIEEVERLRMEPVPWRLAEEIGGGIHWAPILPEGNLRWLQYGIRMGIESAGIELCAALARSIERLEELLKWTARSITFRLVTGDLLLVDNKRCLHARTPVEEPERSERLLLRTKIRRVDAAAD